VKALPNLVVIGAKKSGTTSLYHYLASHPDIWMSREKELDFFVAERNWSRGLGWYRRQFNPGAVVRGEVSPYYTALPQHRGVPERMASVIPDARIVYLVRDPIERLVSHYQMEVAIGRERRPLAAAIANLSESRYVAQGRYWMQLDPYLRNFPPEQVLVVDQDELGHNRAAALRRVFGSLGVDPDFVSQDFDEVHFPGMARRRRRPVAKAILALDRAVGDQRSNNARRRVPARIRAMLTVPLERPALEPVLRARLEELYAPDAARLREHTGLRFGSWSV
jgi:sulfotransferase family protein